MDAQKGGEPLTVAGPEEGQGPQLLPAMLHKCSQLNWLDMQSAASPAGVHHHSTSSSSLALVTLKLADTVPPAAQVQAQQSTAPLHTRALPALCPALPQPFAGCDAMELLAAVLAGEVVRPALPGVGGEPPVEEPGG